MSVGLSNSAAEREDGEFVVKFDVDKPNYLEPFFQFELSVCRTDCHGYQSWGWPSDRKIIVLEGDSETYSADIIELMTKQAALVAKVLNRG